MDCDLLVLGIGISLHKTDGVVRFERYCRAHDLPYVIVGDGIEWRGGMMGGAPGGGHKIIEILNTIENVDNKLIVICDTYDLFPVAGREEILKKYCRLCGIERPTDPGHKIVISSEVYIWPDKSLATVYPKVATKYKYLNSGCIMGFRDEIYEILKNNPVKNSDDDQLYYTLQYLHGNQIILDRECSLFQALAGVTDDIVVHKNRVFNKYTNSYPVFIHGNGPGKLFLNYIENYIQAGPADDYTLITTKCDPEPSVFCALYVDSRNYKPNDLFMSHFVDLHYDNKMVYVYDKTMNPEYKSVIEKCGFVYRVAQEYVFADFLETDCKYYFLLDQQCIITDREILHELITHMRDGRRILAPMLKGRENTLFTNFWGGLTGSGYYRRSDDYMDIVNYNRRGFWNVPYVSHSILFDRDIIKYWDPGQKNKFSPDNDMALCYNMRERVCFMYVSNIREYGYLNGS